MEDKSILKLVDAALKGDKALVQMAVRQFASKIRNENASLYELLSEKLDNKVLRSGDIKNRPIPVDSDSRQSLVRVEDPVEINKSPILSSDVLGCFEQILLERDHIDILKEEGLCPARSVIFQGPPGVGKTMSARWLASKLELPLLTLDLATVMSSFLGKTGSNVRAVLEYAMSFPCVLLLDEFDAIAKRRDDDRELGELKRLVTVLLQTIDDWPSSSLLIAATNHGELLDPAIWRRFDLEIAFTMPSLDMLERYLAEYWPDMVISKDGIEKFSGMSFSNIGRDLKMAKRERIISSLGAAKGLVNSDHIAGVDCMSMEEKKRLVIKLKEEGLSQRSIAKKLGISRPTVKKTVDEM